MLINLTYVRMTEKSSVKARCPSCGDKKVLSEPTGQFRCCGKVWKYHYISGKGDEESMMVYDKSLESQVAKV